MVVDALSKKVMSALSLQHSRWRIASDGVFLVQLKAQPVLEKMIIDAQKNDVELQQKIQLVKDGSKTEYSMGEDGGIYHKDRLCVSTIKGVKNKLLHEAHNTIFTMHPGGNKMYQDLKQYYPAKHL